MIHRHFDVHCGGASFRNSAVTSASLTDVYPAFPQSIQVNVPQIMPHPLRLQVPNFYLCVVTILYSPHSASLIALFNNLQINLMREIYNKLKNIRQHKYLLEQIGYMFRHFISVINQLDAQNFCFTISLFHASTCFEHMCSSSGSQNCSIQPLVSSH